MNTSTSSGRFHFFAVLIAYVIVCLHTGDAQAQLTVRITAAPDPVRPGERISYVMTVANRSTNDLKGVQLVNLIPDHIQSVSHRGASPPDNYCHAGDSMTWDLGALPAGQSSTRLYTALVSPKPPSNALLHSSASVTSAGGAGAKASLNVFVDASPALTLGMTEDPNPVAPGQTLTYTLIYANSGSASLSNVTLRAPVPAGTTFGSASDGGLVSSNKVQWALGTMRAGGSGQRTFTVAVNGGLSNGEILSGYAEIAGGLGTENTARATTATAVHKTE